MDAEETTWVSETGKRLREERDQKEAELAEHAAKAQARAAESERVKVQKLRDAYPYYDADLLEIKRAIKRAVPMLHLEQFCWLFSTPACFIVSVTTVMPTWRVMPHEERDIEGFPFRHVERIPWTIPSSLPAGLLSVCLRDIKSWAFEVGLETSHLDYKNTDEQEYFRMPFIEGFGNSGCEAMLAKGILLEITAQDSYMGLRVPLPPPPPPPQ